MRRARACLSVCPSLLPPSLSLSHAHLSYPTVMTCLSLWANKVRVLSSLSASVFFVLSEGERGERGEKRLNDNNHIRIKLLVSHCVVNTNSNENSHM